MEKEELYNKFVKWIEEKIKGEFPISDKFLLVCLEDVIELQINSTINNIPIVKQYSHDKLMKEILKSWQSHAKLFLELPKSNVNMIFREVNVPLIEDRGNLLFQINQLNFRCEN